MSADLQSKRWCFTLYSDEPHPVYPDTEEISYVCFQREVCPKTQSLHWQGYIEFHSRKRRDTIKKLLGYNHIHLEACKGSPQSNRDYCTKSPTSVPGTFFEWGVISNPKPGRRSDLEELVEDIVQGRSIYDIIVEQPKHLRHIGHMQRLQQYAPSLERDIKVHYIWGPPGSGKSRYVYNLIKHEPFSRPLIAPPNIWWQDYQGQKTVWLDDLDIKQFSLESLLHILDRYPLTLQVKGGSQPARFTTVYITSNHSPRDFPSQLSRRFSTVVAFQAGAEHGDGGEDEA